VSATAVTDIFYLLHKGLGDVGKAKESMERLLQFTNIVDVTGLDIQTALSSSMPDFEDAVVHAVALRCKADYILTRNTKDFGTATVPVIPPAAFMNL